ncbi:MAG: polysaccharide deacetylase family protein, partial [Cyclobacteriaceae bacterium]|nr:polysaccharide deacetylase family protein [Cyclobacteriaceae bacterium]
MMKRKTICYLPVFVLFIVFSLTLTIQSCNNGHSAEEAETITPPSNWAERLGFPPGKKVLILHADDIGMCEEATIAATRYLENGNIQSAAGMPPCPDFENFIEWAKAHPDKDVGLHLTLTSEWKTYRWGPVSDPADVPSLIDPEGKLWHEVPDVLAHATPEDIEKEIRAQVEKSIALGYRPDHIDTHMGTLFAHLEYTKSFMKVAQEYGIPANIIEVNNEEMANQFRKAGYPITEEFIAASNSYT